MTDTLVTVIIPTSDNHLPYLPKAIASVQAQTVSTKCIVVFDGEKTINVPQNVEILKSTSNYRTNAQRVSFARNMGLAHVKTPFVIFLDADDTLTINAVEILLRGYVSEANRAKKNKTPQPSYIYSNFYVTDGKNVQLNNPPKYEQELYRSFNIHPITCLLQTEHVEAVGGFDENIRAFEDWELFYKLAIHGYCGEYTPGPIFTYHNHLSVNSVKDNVDVRAKMKQVADKYISTEFAMCGCGKNYETSGIIKQIGVNSIMDGNLWEYVGEGNGGMFFRGAVTGNNYYASRSVSNRYVVIDEKDASWAEASGLFRRLPKAEPPFEMPVAEEPVIVKEEEQKEIIEVAEKPIITKKMKVAPTNEAEQTS